MKRTYGDVTATPLSPAVGIGNFLFISGQVPTDTQGLVPDGIVAQTRLVLGKIDRLLKDAGFTRADVVKTTVFLKETGDFPSMNGVYRDFFGQDFPARSTVRAELMIDARVEIDAIAMKAA
jgi:reactive intermediate/imine deaminase